MNLVINVGSYSSDDEYIYSINIKTLKFGMLIFNKFLVNFCAF